MAEYIDIDKSYDTATLEDWYINSVTDDAPIWTEEHLEELLNDFYVIPKDTPAADVEEVIHAHWEAVEREAFWLSDADIWMESGKPTIHLMPVCSHCKTEFGTIVLDFKRCPECGAKMDEERRSE